MHGFGVKHLNPRQGITTSIARAVDSWRQVKSVKHLNPRQGITTRYYTGGSYGG